MTTGRILNEMQKLDTLYSMRQNDYDSQIRKLKKDQAAMAETPHLRQLDYDAEIEAVKKAQIFDMIDYMEISVFYQNAFDIKTGNNLKEMKESVIAVEGRGRNHATTKTLEEMEKSAKVVERNAKFAAPTGKATKNTFTSEGVSSSATSSHNEMFSDIPVSSLLLTGSLSPSAHFTLGAPDDRLAKSSASLTSTKKNARSANPKGAAPSSRKRKSDAEGTNKTSKNAKKLPSNIENHILLQDIPKEQDN